MAEESQNEIFDGVYDESHDETFDGTGDVSYGGSSDGGADGAGGQEFFSALSEDQRALATRYGWQDAQGVFDGYRALEDRLSQSVPLPEEGADAEEQAEFYSEISKSWTPKDGYRFKMPETLPEEFPYDQSFAEEASGWFQEAGLHPQAAQQLHDKWVGKMAEHFASHNAAAGEAAAKQTKTAEAAHQALIREYGAPESDGYQNVVAKADRALDGLKSAGVDLSGWFAEKGALTAVDANGLQQVADPTAVKLLAFIHDSAFAEDGLAGLAGGGEGGNPFDRDRPDLRQQSDLLDRNPARARQMILSAGRDPGLFGV